MDESVLLSLLEKAGVDEDVQIRNESEERIELTNGDVYLVFDQHERDEIAKNEVIYAFGHLPASFLRDVTGLPVSLFEGMSKTISPDDVEQILEVVGISADDLMKEAVDDYGYARFLSGDSETELRLAEGYYAYKLN